MENVDVIERGKITVNIYEGQKGDPGKALRFEDLTPEQIGQLKGPKGDAGDPATIPHLNDIYQQLKYKGFVAKSDAVDDIVTLIVEQVNFPNKVESSVFTYQVPKYNDTSVRINCNGLDGMELVERGTQNKEVLNAYTATHQILFTLSKPMTEQDVNIDVVWDGQIRKTFTIKGVYNINIPALIGNVNYQTHSDNRYVTATYDNGNTLYFKQTKQTGILDNPVALINEAKNNNDIPASVNTLVLEVGGPITLDYTAQYPTNKDAMIFDGVGQSPIIRDGDIVMDLRGLKVDCKNIVFVLNQKIHNDKDKSVNGFYVITDKQQSISMANRNGNDVSQPHTELTKGVTVAYVRQDDVVVSLTDAYEEHL